MMNLIENCVVNITMESILLAVKFFGKMGVIEKFNLEGISMAASIILLEIVKRQCSANMGLMEKKFSSGYE